MKATAHQTTFPPALLGRMSLRRPLLGLAAAVALMMPALKAPAETEETAVEVVKFTIDSLKDLANRSATEEELIANLEAVIEKTSDVQAIGSIALGIAWRTASDKQRKDFIGVYQAYLARKYFDKFKIFIYGRFDVIATRTVKENTIFDVVTLNHYKREQPFRVRWKVVKRNGKTRIYNIILDGINMLATEQRIIRRELKKRNDDLDRLIADLSGVNGTALGG